MPEAFIETYYNLNENKSATAIIINAIFNRFDKKCPSVEVAGDYFICLRKNNNRVTGSHYALGLKLEEDLSQEECLNYFASKHDFLDQAIGIENASIVYF